MSSINQEGSIYQWESIVKPLLWSVLTESIFSDRSSQTNQSGYEPLNLENGLFVNSDNFDANNLRLYYIVTL